VVVVVDDVKGQLSVTAFQMDQSSVMPLRPGAPGPEAPFDPGRFFGGPNNVVRVCVPQLWGCSAHAENATSGAVEAGRGVATRKQQQKMEPLLAGN
jgi:hypothetical protein